MSNFTSYQHGAEEAQLQPQHITQTIRHNPETTRVVVREGVQSVETAGQDKARSSEAGPFHGTEGIFSTARNANGTPVMVIGDDTLLEYQGVQATAKTLAMAGVISRNPDGTYAESQSSLGNPETEESPEEATGSGDVPIHPVNMAEIHEAVTGLDEGVVHGILSIGIGVASGKLDAGKLEDHWARATGQRGEDSKLGRLQAIFQFQADRATMKAGIAQEDLGNFYEWAKANHRDQLADAIQKQVHQASSAGYATLAAKYMSSSAPSVEALKAAGLQVRKSSHRHGQVEVFIPRAGAGWMSPSAAARAGFL